MRFAQFLTAAILFVNFTTTVVAAPHSAGRSDNQISARRPNQNLADVNTLWIDIQLERNSIDVNSFLLNQIKHKCSEKLQKTSVIVTSDPNLCSWSARSKIPILKIRINVSDINATPTHIFYTRTSLSRIVSLATKNEPILFKADVWESKPIMKSVDKAELPEAITDAVLRQVDEFIAAWSFVNAPDANTPQSQSQNTAVEKDATPAKQQVTESKYVASKTSKVFHKPDCQFAGRILPKNLVSYNSREDAIAANKRPCSRCNP